MVRAGVVRPASGRRGSARRARRRGVARAVHRSPATARMVAFDEQLDAAAKAELDENGMTIIEDLLTPAQTAQALAAIQKLFADGHAEDQHKDIHYTMNLTARDEIFREIVTLPRLVSLESHLLGDDYILSGALEVIRYLSQLVRPGGVAYRLSVCLLQCGSIET